MKALQCLRAAIMVMLSFFSATLFADGTWTVTGSMNTTRMGHTVTLLKNGKVLVAGGQSGTSWQSSTINTAELYDSNTGVWTTIKPMNQARGMHTATLLPNGNVLVAGGTNGPQYATNTAEIYNPITGNWTNTGNMNTGRVQHSATLITTGVLAGKVLVVGGYASCGADAGNCVELYDPATKVWTTTGNMPFASAFSTNSINSHQLSDGSVLVVGGTDCCPYHSFSKAAIFNPNTQTWTASNTTTRAQERLVLLSNMNILVAGGMSGWQGSAVSVNDTELFNPKTGVWTAMANMSTARTGHSLVALENGQVLTAGGSPDPQGCSALNSAEIYNPINNTWNTTASMNIARVAHSTVLLKDNEVLVVGGSNCSNVISSAELYTPANSTIVNGTVTWAKPPYSVKCINNTTAENILLPRNKTTKYDCEKSGLAINSGDNVTVIVNGNKK